MAIFNGTCKIQQLYIKSNYLTEQNIIELQKKVQEKKIVLHTDLFERLKNVRQEKLERSIWISPIWDNSQDAANLIKTFFEDQAKVGVVVDVRIRNGLKIPGKLKSNIFAIVEFAHPNSVLKALRIASKKKASIGKNKIKIFKAGSQVALQVRPVRKR